MEWLGTNRRRLGTGMVVFGVAGMLMATIVAVALVLGAFAVRDLDERLEADQARIAASLTRLSVTMESIATTTQNAGTTLETSSQAMLEARDVLESTSTTLVSVAEALDVSILGQQPLAGASERLTNLARVIARFKDRATTVAVNLHQNSADAAVLASHVRQLRTQVNELATRISGFDRIGEMVALLIGGIVLAALLTAWVGIAAAFLAWVGWKLRRLEAADPAGSRGPAEGSAAG
jgi:methyl-accepting chemotaxis protein